eukprot:TRINITY_DN8245_c0_g1_i1.p1 TRINITY_DN8245_c0_g1~~TRINITY_DN8245_c0_g1_i1.p1  ORF type:complete len:255 (+),score=55.14 TRINITY_DN8245_c0_g1_i1:246-1010(+)
MRVISYGLRLYETATALQSTPLDNAINLLDDISLCCTLMAGVVVVVVWALAFYIAHHSSVEDAVAIGLRLRIFGYVLGIVTLLQLVLVDGILRFVFTDPAQVHAIDQASDWLYLALCLVYAIAVLFHSIRLRRMLQSYPDQTGAKSRAILRQTVMTVAMVVAVPLHAIVYIICTHALNGQILSGVNPGGLFVVFMIQDVFMQWLPSVLVLYGMSNIRDMRLFRLDDEAAQQQQHQSSDKFVPSPLQRYNSEEQM